MDYSAQKKSLRKVVPVCEAECDIGLAFPKLTLAALLEKDG